MWVVSECQIHKHISLIHCKINIDPNTRRTHFSWIRLVQVGALGSHQTAWEAYSLRVGAQHTARPKDRSPLPDPGHPGLGTHPNSTFIHVQVACALRLCQQNTANSVSVSRTGNNIIQGSQHSGILHDCQKECATTHILRQNQLQDIMHFFPKIQS